MRDNIFKIKDIWDKNNNTFVDNQTIFNNINGKMLNVIQNIYKDIKSNIIFNNSKSDYFPCGNG